MRALIGLDLEDVRGLLGPAEPPYRARQLYEALYRRRIRDLAEATDLPAALRRKLAEETSLGLPHILERYESADGTRRYLLETGQGGSVEAVFMPEESRDTLCISTQIGCPAGCRFCLTGLMGLERNLTAGEILGQVLELARDNGLDPHSRRLNIVLMGQGEPLLNLPEVLKAVRILADPRAVGVPERRMTLSTVGIVPKIRELGQAPVRPKLAVSLNGSTREQRSELMPLARKYPLEELIEACRRYPLRPWEKLTFEYVLLKGVNDSPEDARRVVRLLSRLNCKVNLIAWNPGPGLPFETPEPERVEAFQAILRRSFPTFIRKPRGRDIFAACGQLKRASAGELVRP